VKTVEQLARAFRDDSVAATEELAAEYARIKEPLQAGEFLLRVIEAMARAGISWERADAIVSRDILK
jgi:hypothetical protein